MGAHQVDNHPDRAFRRFLDSVYQPTNAAIKSTKVMGLIVAIKTVLADGIRIEVS